MTINDNACDAFPSQLDQWFNFADIRGLLAQAVEIYEQIMDAIENRDQMTFDRGNGNIWEQFF